MSLSKVRLLLLLLLLPPIPCSSPIQHIHPERLIRESKACLPVLSSRDPHHRHPTGQEVSLAPPPHRSFSQQPLPPLWCPLWNRVPPKVPHALQRHHPRDRIPAHPRRAKHRWSSNPQVSLCPSFLSAPLTCPAALPPLSQLTCPSLPTNSC